MVLFRLEPQASERPYSEGWFGVGVGFVWTLREMVADVVYWHLHGPVCGASSEEPSVLGAGEGEGALFSCYSSSPCAMPGLVRAPRMHCPFDLHDPLWTGGLVD